MIAYLILGPGLPSIWIEHNYSGPLLLNGNKSPKLVHNCLVNKYRLAISLLFNIIVPCDRF